MHDAPIGLATLIGIYFVDNKVIGKRSESQDARCPNGYGIYFVDNKVIDAQDVPSEIEILNYLFLLQKRNNE